MLLLSKRILRKNKQYLSSFFSDMTRHRYGIAIWPLVFGLVLGGIYKSDGHFFNSSFFQEPVENLLLWYIELFHAQCNQKASCLLFDLLLLWQPIVPFRNIFTFCVL